MVRLVTVMLLSTVTVLELLFTGAMIAVSGVVGTSPLPTFQIVELLQLPVVPVQENVPAYDRLRTAVSESWLVEAARPKLKYGLPVEPETLRFASDGATPEV